MEIEDIAEKLELLRQEIEKAKSLTSAADISEADRQKLAEKEKEIEALEKKIKANYEKLKKMYEW